MRFGKIIILVAMMVVGFGLPATAQEPEQEPTAQELGPEPAPAP